LIVSWASRRRDPSTPADQYAEGEDFMNNIKINAYPLILLILVLIMVMCALTVNIN